MTEEIVLNTSDKAAHYETGIEGWVDRGDRFFGVDERGARWSGCTHILCKHCGVPTPKSYLLCENCREKKNTESYSKLKRKKWDMKAPIYSETTRSYFFTLDDLQDYLEDAECTMQSLQLVLCDPEYLPEIEEDYFCDSLSDDGELPLNVQKALADLNKVIQEEGPVSYLPGDYAVDISELEKGKGNG